MGYENDPYRDEDGEPLMDPDMGFDQEAEDNEEDWREEREPTPIHNYDPDKVGKPRKRLIKKSIRDDFDVGGDEAAMNFVRDDFENDDNDQMYNNSKRKSSSGAGGSGKKEKRMKSSERRIDRGGGYKNSSRSAGGSSGKSSSRANNGVDPELERDMWNTVAGGNSEDDEEGVKNMDDENFIDDTGVDPADRYGSDNERYVRDAPQAEEGEEDDEVERLFKGGKKKKKPEKSAAEMALVVEHLMAELELTAENDAELNMENKPAVEKLKKLPLLIEVLSKKQFQLEFLDRGVLTLLKNWLEPLPDGSLPNINIRTAILKILTDFPIDLEQFDRREQLKKSGLGKVIMFLSRSDEETTGNRRLAKDLVDKWSRPIFNKSTRFEDMKHTEDDRVPYRRPQAKKRMDKAATLDSRDDDLDEFSRERKSGESSSRQHASRPEAAPLDFMVRPQSKIDPDEIRARAKQVVHDQRRVKMNKKLQQLKAPKKKMLQASKLSVEGRGMVKFF